MAGGSADDGAKYDVTTAAVFVFNLIVGAGALALPDAFSQAGCVPLPLLSHPATRRPPRDRETESRETQRQEVER